ncbi:AI-2E family transporter [Opitutales bacterium ASA1]|uniref:AI-2E family transporter n=1 Tax=Congregicoccus parvus TaxID=3081749 RepID=UPI002B29193F|nr:AI-2E family transporter [Opitutales bacterium ASA1]
MLAVIATLAALYLVRSVVVPIVVACIFALLLRPLVGRLHRWHIHPFVSASVVILVGAGALVFSLVSLQPAAKQWFDEAPAATRKIERFLSDLRRPVEDVGKAGERLENLTSGSDARRTVELKQPGIAERALWGTVDVAWALVLVMFVLFFLLGTNGRLIHNLGRFVCDRASGSDAAELVEATSAHVSRYLATITVVNACLGVAIGTALGLVGLPNPVLWGVMAALLNFVPYLGGLVGVSIVALAGIMTFDTLAPALAGPALYIVINSLEGMLITPAVLGRRFRLDPAACLIWLVFWGWLWGVPGALLAIPMLTIVKIAGDHIESLRPFSRLVSADPVRPRADVAPFPLPNGAPHSNVG